ARICSARPAGPGLISCAMRLMPRARRLSGIRSRVVSSSAIAISPVSWGVSEIRNWGAQLDPERVLREIASLGEPWIEAGPSGFLPDRSDAARPLLKRHHLK